MARDPAAFAGAGQPVEPGGAGGAASHSHVRAGWCVLGGSLCGSLQRPPGRTLAPGAVRNRKQEQLAGA